MASRSTTKRDVFFFDVDDCLYSQDHKVDSLVAKLIHEYISANLGLSNEETRALTENYYQTYGLTVIGLQRFHKVDPMDFNRQVDGRLPMDNLLSRSEELIQFFTSFDRSKVKLWLLTNAHVTHALRVVGLLGIAHFFEGITYCNYDSPVDGWTCKPSPEMLQKAEREAGVLPETRCFFVDDSVKNCTAAVQRGWDVLWIQNGTVGPSQILPPPLQTEKEQQLTRIESLTRIPDFFPQLFTNRKNHWRRLADQVEKQAAGFPLMPVGLCAAA